MKKRTRRRRVRESDTCWRHVSLVCLLLFCSPVLCWCFGSLSPRAAPRGHHARGSNSLSLSMLSARKVLRPFVVDADARASVAGSGIALTYCFARARTLAPGNALAQASAQSDGPPTSLGMTVRRERGETRTTRTTRMCARALALGGATRIEGLGRKKVGRMAIAWPRGSRNCP